MNIGRLDYVKCYKISPLSLFTFNNSSAYRISMKKKVTLITYMTIFYNVIFYLSSELNIIELLYNAFSLVIVIYFAIYIFFLLVLKGLLKNLAFS